jgi:putative membrane protein
MAIGTTHRRYALILGGIFLLWWLFLAINPSDRKDWALENLIAVVTVAYLVLTARRFPLSRLSYTLLFLFLCLHEVGAHYTYAEVPYDRWFEALFGHTLNSLVGWERNNFDRVVHFSYGLLLAYPIREVFHRVADARGFWAYFLPLEFTMATSMLFELFEWLAAEFFGGDLGVAYLGAQGDIWDAQKDMALASLGALVAMLVTAGINMYLQRDFAREWADSLKVKEKSPLGEDEIRRMLTRRKDDNPDSE